MFDILPDLLSSLTTVLFPVFASYKALRTSDPAQLTPWLMYWVVFSCFSLLESWTYFILRWLPFYAYIRLILLSYLVLPQTQGARLIYQQHIHPFLTHHEHEIEKFITSAHDRAKAAGLQYVKQTIEFLKQNLLGIEAKPRPAALHAPTSNYAQSLLSRFNLPSARQGFAAPAGDFSSLLSAAMSSIGASGGASRESQVEDLSRSGSLIPEGLQSTSEKMTFLSTQRERLRVLLTALDKEASDLGANSAIEQDGERRFAIQQTGEGLKKSKSEAEFEEIDKDGLRGEMQGTLVATGGWMPWNWSPKAVPTARAGAEKAMGLEK